MAAGQAGTLSGVTAGAPGAAPIPAVFNTLPTDMATGATIMSPPLPYREYDGMDMGTPGRLAGKGGNTDGTLPGARRAWGLNPAGWNRAWGAIPAGWNVEGAAPIPTGWNAANDAG